MTGDTLLIGAFIALVVTLFLLDLFVWTPVPKLGPTGPACPACGQRVIVYHVGLGILGAKGCICGPEDYLREITQKAPTGGARGECAPGDTGRTGVPPRAQRARP